MTGRKTYRWVSDFETTTDPNDCRVWLWALCNIDNVDSVDIGTDIDSFVERVSHSNNQIYFHNLKFDGSFLLSYLLENGFQHVETRYPAPGQFTTIIDQMPTFYSITVAWHTTFVTEFRDSLKKLPMGVSDIAKTFDLEESKGVIDYNKNRPVGYVPDDNEREYVTNDVKIVARALKMQIDEGMTSLTIAADSLREYKKLLGRKVFDRMFPILPRKIDNDIRRAYRGGFAYADERTRGKLVGKGSVYDVNSIYPYIMYDRILPYGEPIYCHSWPKPTKTHPLYIVTITLTAKIKKNRIPCIQIKNNSSFVQTEYQRVIKEPTQLTMTNIDLELIQEHYDVDILTYDGGWLFSGVQGLFDKYVEKWSAIKIASTGGMKAIAKLHLNSLYGKFATNPDVTGKVPYLNDKGILAFHVGEAKERDPVYTAMGVFITSYAREMTIRAAQEHYDVFLYADTDSLHLLEGEHNLDIDQSRLGAWKHEYYFNNALFARAKRYSELTDDGYVTHIAGLPKHLAEDVTFDDYFTSKEITGKLLPKRVHGGIVLEETSFRLTI